MSRELEALASLSHATTAVGYAVAIGGLGLAVAGHVLGRPYNRARGNRTEAGFHRAGLIVAGAAIVWSAFAVGVDSLAAVSHRRDARDLT